MTELLKGDCMIAAGEQELSFLSFNLTCGLALKGWASGPWRGVPPCLPDVIDSAAVIST